jgi:predicted transcriptional regulator
MTSHILIPAKAITDAELSNAIVVSFDSEWYEHLLAKRFSVVIRKRVPKRRKFEWLYLHINSPVSAICGRAQIKTITDIPMEQAIALAREIALSPDEIKSYIGEGDRYIGCYKLGIFQFGKKPLSTTELSTRMIYHPPQSFFILSKRSKELVDQMAGFIQLEAIHSRKPQKT